jgi:5-methylcytosine-specific restriction endonuclease McrA
VGTRRSRAISQDVKIAVTLRDEGKWRVYGSKKDLQYDHVYPWSLGGRSDDPNNIQLLCGYHNRLKGNR